MRAGEKGIILRPCKRRTDNAPSSSKRPGGRLRSQAPRVREKVATAVADLTIIPLLLIGGILLWRRQARGYILGAGLLFLISMLFVGLLIVLLLLPLVSGLPFPLVDFVVILVMGLVSFIPLGLFCKGVQSTSE